MTNKNAIDSMIKVTNYVGNGNSIKTWISPWFPLRLPKGLKRIILDGCVLHKPRLINISQFKHYNNQKRNVNENYLNRFHFKYVFILTKITL